MNLRKDFKTPGSAATDNELFTVILETVEANRTTSKVVKQTDIDYILQCIDMFNSAKFNKRVFNNEYHESDIKLDEAIFGKFILPRSIRQVEGEEKYIDFLDREDEFNVVNFDTSKLWNSINIVYSSMKLTPVERKLSELRLDKSVDAKMAEFVYEGLGEPPVKDSYLPIPVTRPVVESDIYFTMNEDTILKRYINDVFRDARK